MNNPYAPLSVMAGLVPAIHGRLPHLVHVDARNKSGHDGGKNASVFGSRHRAGP